MRFFAPCDRCFEGRRQNYDNVTLIAHTDISHRIIHSLTAAPYSEYYVHNSMTAVSDKMEFRNLATFVRAAELRSFSQAARQLGYSQSAVSMQISQLEAELNVSLFDRVGKTVALTPNGARFYEYAQNILRMAENARSLMSDPTAISGQLRIAMAESIYMSLFPKILNEYCRRYPGVTLIIQSADTVEMFKALTQNDVDMIYHLDHQIYRPDIVTPHSRPVHLIFAAAKGHPLAEKPIVSIDECIRYPFILTEKGMSYRSLLDAKLAKLGLSIDPTLETGNTDVIVRLLPGNDWITFLPEFAMQEQLENGSIVRLNVPGIDIELYRQVICHKGKWVTPAMQAMIDMLRAADGEIDDRL